MKDSDLINVLAEQEAKEGDQEVNQAAIESLSAAPAPEQEAQLENPGLMQRLYDE